MSDAGRTAGPWARLVALVALVVGLSSAAVTAGLAHEVRPAYLELREGAPGSFDVLFKTPMLGDLRLALGVAFSGRVEPVTPVLSRVTDDAMVQTWRVRATDALPGQQVRIVGLENTVTDALLRVESVDGRSWVQRLTPESPRATIPAPRSGSGVAATYLRLGVEHILLGYDHLLLVLGLILIAASTRQLVMAITAFTAAHSITLAAAVLGVVHVPPKPVEAVIALSIAFVAVEIVRAREGKAGAAARAPWLVAFAFGLLHGFGFAGALSEIGMPEGHIPAALLFFNLGVEAGQLLFVAAVMVSTALVRLIRLPLPRWAALAPPYVIGSVAMFWVLQRIAAF
jgi:hydrogenase/urease accessory protein HupE